MLQTRSLFRLFILAYLLTVAHTQSPPLSPDHWQQRVLRLARDGELEELASLVQQNGDVNFARHSISPLLVASRYNQTEIVSFLLRQGADPNPPNSNNVAPVWIASFKNLLQIVDLLLVYGADIDVENSRGVTSLYVAAQEGHVEMVRFLLDHQAGVDHAAMTGATPLLIAAQGGHVSVVRVLLENGAESNVQTVEKQQSALWIASVLGYLDVVLLLLQYPTTNPNLLASDGTSALHKSIQAGHERIMRVLCLEERLNVNVVDNNGWTALHYACQNENAQQVEFLLNHGADSTVQTNNGQTAESMVLQSSSESFRSDVLPLLRQEANLVEDDNFSLGSTEIKNLLISLGVLGLVLIPLLFWMLIWSRKKYKSVINRSKKVIVRKISAAMVPITRTETGRSQKTNTTPSCPSQATDVMIPDALSPEILRTFAKPNPQQIENNVVHEETVNFPVTVELQNKESSVDLESSELKETPTNLWLDLYEKREEHHERIEEIARGLDPGGPSSSASQGLHGTHVTAGPSIERRNKRRNRRRQEEKNEFVAPIVDPHHGIGNYGVDQTPHPSPYLSDPTLCTTESDWPLTRASSGPYSFLEEWLKTNASEEV